MTHTPGPWKRGKADFADRIVTDSDDQQQTIAEVWYFGHSCATLDANACLLAAAPELLEALEEAAELLDDAASGEYKPDSFSSEAARAVIATARGKR